MFISASFIVLSLLLAPPSPGGGDTKALETRLHPLANGPNGQASFAKLRQPACVSSDKARELSAWYNATAHATCFVEDKKLFPAPGSRLRSRFSDGLASRRYAENASKHGMRMHSCDVAESDPSVGAFSNETSGSKPKPQCLTSALIVAEQKKQGFHIVLEKRKGHYIEKIERALSDFSELYYHSQNHLDWILESYSPYYPVENFPTAPGVAGDVTSEMHNPTSRTALSEFLKNYGSCRGDPVLDRCPVVISSITEVSLAVIRAVSRTSIDWYLKDMSFRVKLHIFDQTVRQNFKAVKAFIYSSLKPFIPVPRGIRRLRVQVVTYLARNGYIPLSFYYRVLSLPLSIGPTSTSCTVHNPLESLLDKHIFGNATRPASASTFDDAFAFGSEYTITVGFARDLLISICFVYALISRIRRTFARPQSVSASDLYNQAILGQVYGQLSTGLAPTSTAPISSTASISAFDGLELDSVNVNDHLDDDGAIAHHDHVNERQADADADAVERPRDVELEVRADNQLALGDGHHDHIDHIAEHQHQPDLQEVVRRLAIPANSTHDLATPLSLFGMPNPLVDLSSPTPPHSFHSQPRTPGPGIASVRSESLDDLASQLRGFDLADFKFG